MYVVQLDALEHCAGALHLYCRDILLTALNVVVEPFSPIPSAALSSTFHYSQVSSIPNDIEGPPLIG
jgi:hypothetical protein